jgi:hypothetical protein
VGEVAECSISICIYEYDKVSRYFKKKMFTLNLTIIVNIAHITINKKKTINTFKLFHLVIDIAASRQEISIPILEKLITFQHHITSGE